MVDGATIRTALAAVGAVGKQIRSFDELAAGANDALRQAPPGLTAAGAASFLATCAQESAYFRTTREYGSGQWYAPWIGRGFVQCTHKANYQAFGRWAHARKLISDPNLFINNRTALEDYRYAWATAVWYFDETKLWGWANAGDHLRTQQAVNGGRGRAGTKFVPNHWSARKKMFDAFARAGPALLPTGPPATSTAARPRVSGDDLVANFDWPAGSYNKKLICPVGSASQIASHGWISVACDGSIAKLDLWYQRDGAGITEDHVKLGKDQRFNRPLPDGTTQVTVHVTGATGPVGAALEYKPR